MQLNETQNPETDSLESHEIQKRPGFAKKTPLDEQPSMPDTLSYHTYLPGELYIASRE